MFISWENEAHLALKEFGADKFEIVMPSVSILAEPSVAVVDQVAIRHGTRTVAEEYLKYLYSKDAQQIIARNFYRPRDAEVAAAFARQFPAINLVTVQELGGWTKLQQTHFAEGGVFDRLLSAR